MAIWIPVKVLTATLKRERGTILPRRRGVVTAVQPPLLGATEPLYLVLMKLREPQRGTVETWLEAKYLSSEEPLPSV